MQNKGGFGSFMSASLKCLVEEIDFLLAERRELSARGPHFRIVHSLSDARRGLYAW